MEKTAPTVYRNGFLINAAAFVIVIAGLKAAGSIAILVLVSTFLAIICAPAVLQLRKQRVPSALAALLVVIAMIGVITVLGVIVGTSINGFVQEAPTYRARLNDQAATAVAWAQEYGLASYVTDQLEAIDAGSVISVAATTFSAMGALFGNSLLIILIVTFVLLEVSTIPVKLKAAYGGSDESFGHLREIARNVVRYLALKTVISLATGVGVGLWVAVFRLDFSVLWGLLAFVLNYIPNFGSLVAAIPAVLLALVLLGPTKALFIAIGYLAVNFVVGNVIEPKVMGEGLGLSTLIVILSLLFWGWVFGTAGMFLAVPLTMAAKIILNSHEDTKFLAILMGPGKEADLPTAGTASPKESPIE